MAGSPFDKILQGVPVISDSTQATQAQKSNTVTPVNTPIADQKISSQVNTGVSLVSNNINNNVTQPIANPNDYKSLYDFASSNPTEYASFLSNLEKEGLVWNKLDEKQQLSIVNQVNQTSGFNLDASLPTVQDSNLAIQQQQIKQSQLEAVKPRALNDQEMMRLDKELFKQAEEQARKQGRDVSSISYTYNPSTDQINNLSYAMTPKQQQDKSSIISAIDTTPKYSYTFSDPNTEQKVRMEAFSELSKDLQKQPGGGMITNKEIDRMMAELLEGKYAKGIPIADEQASKKSLDSAYSFFKASNIARAVSGLDSGQIGGKSAYTLTAEDEANLGSDTTKQLKDFVKETEYFAGKGATNVRSEYDPITKQNKIVFTIPESSKAQLPSTEDKKTFTELLQIKAERAPLKMTKEDTMLDYVKAPTENLFTLGREAYVGNLDNKNPFGSLEWNIEQIEKGRAPLFYQKTATGDIFNTGVEYFKDAASGKPLEGKKLDTLVKDLTENPARTLGTTVGDLPYMFFPAGEAAGAIKSVLPSAIRQVAVPSALKTSAQTLETIARSKVINPIAKSDSALVVDTAKGIRTVQNAATKVNEKVSDLLGYVTRPTSIEKQVTEGLYIQTVSGKTQTALENLLGKENIQGFGIENPSRLIKRFDVGLEEGAQGVEYTGGLVNIPKGEVTLTGRGMVSAEELNKMADVAKHVTVTTADEVKGLKPFVQSEAKIKPNVPELPEGFKIAEQKSILTPQGQIRDTMKEIVPITKPSALPQMPIFNTSPTIEYASKTFGIGRQGQKIDTGFAVTYDIKDFIKYGKIAGRNPEELKQLRGNEIEKALGLPTRKTTPFSVEKTLPETSTEQVLKEVEKPMISNLEQKQFDKILDDLSNVATDQKISTPNTRTAVRATLGIGTTQQNYSEKETVGLGGLTGRERKKNKEEEKITNEISFVPLPPSSSFPSSLYSPRSIQESITGLRSDSSTKMGNAQILRDISKMENVQSNIPSEKQVLKDLEKVADSMQFRETTRDRGKLYRLDFTPRREFAGEPKIPPRTREAEASLPTFTPKNKEIVIPKPTFNIPKPTQTKPLKETFDPLNPKPSRPDEPKISKIVIKSEGVIKGLKEWNIPYLFPRTVVKQAKRKKDFDLFV